jgi:hypothetical protein
VNVKRQLMHGKWLPWLKANVPFSVTQAAAYMAVLPTPRQICGDRKFRTRSSGETVA